jgi:hypothetical protein
LTGADLVSADLSGANLWNANLEKANLRCANLTGANLTGANFSRASLRNANLRETFPAWESHAYWGELLSQKAVTREQQALSCLVAAGGRFSLCWADFLNWGHPLLGGEWGDDLQEWALTTIASYKLNLRCCPPKAAILKESVIAG